MKQKSKNSCSFLVKQLINKHSKRRAKQSARFFKTQKGEYGEGDLFLGITVPELRKISKNHLNLSLKEIQILLKNKFHEIRFIGLLSLIKKYKKSNPDIKKNIFCFYLKNSLYVNNWDLVDISAPKIVGDYLKDGNKEILKKLAKSKNLWERRISIVSTLSFIKKKDFKWTFKICEILMKDKEDLIHKACGWMLREIGKNGGKSNLKQFLNNYKSILPRTMLRYSIEHFSKKERCFYLNKKTTC